MENTWRRERRHEQGGKRRKNYLVVYSDLVGWGKRKIKKVLTPTKAIQDPSFTALV